MYLIDITIILGSVSAAGAAVLLTYYFFRVRPFQEATIKLREELAQIKKENQQLNKKLDEAKQSLAECGQLNMMANLSAGMLHQISQPVTAIYGLVNFLKKEVPEEASYIEPLNVIDQQADYLKEILENLMKIYKHKEIQRSDVDLNQIVEKSLKLLADELRIARVECQLRLTSDPIVVDADPIHIQQVFMNIIINAIQALKIFPLLTRKRTIYIYSQVFFAEGEALVSFKNNGPVLSPDQQANIFEPFYSTKSEGAGIGLALCRKLVEEYDGTIIAHTTDGLTEFEIKFPLKNEQ